MQRVATGHVLNIGTLQAFLCDILRGFDLAPAAAWRAADVLLAADLRGIPSHGCIRLPSFYAPLLRNGTIRPGARLQRIRRQGVLQILDGGGGFGLALAPLAMQRAVRCAARFGAGAVWLLNSTHFGIASYYSLLAARAGMLGLVLTNGSPAVAPPGSKRPLFGTNALSVAMPLVGAPPFVVDMASSNTSLGQLEEQSRLGMLVPAHVAAEALQARYDLQPDDLVDPALVQSARLLSPLGGGGNAEGYKGFALALIIELLTALLPGGLASFDLQAGQACHVFLALRPELLQDPFSLSQAFQRLRSSIEETPVLAGYPQLRLPGTRSNQHYAECLTHGLCLPDETLKLLRALAESLDLPIPAELAEVPHVDS